MGCVSIFSGNFVCVCCKLLSSSFFFSFLIFFKKIVWWVSLDELQTVASFSMKQRFERGEHATWVSTIYEKDLVFNVFWRWGWQCMIDFGWRGLLAVRRKFWFFTFFPFTLELLFMLEGRFRGGGFIFCFKSFFFFLILGRYWNEGLGYSLRVQHELQRKKQRERRREGIWEQYY